MTVTFMRFASRRQVELLGAPRRVGLPAAAGRAAPVELARLEAAALAAVAGEAPRVAVHEIAHQLQVAPALGRCRPDDLRLEQPVQAEQRRVAPQLVAHQLVGDLDALRLERLLEHRVEQIERRVALEVAGQQRQALLGAPHVAVGLEQALRREREVRGVLRLDPLPVLDRALQLARRALEVAELQAGAHALAVRLQRLLQVPARRVRSRMRRLGRGELAQVLRDAAAAGFAGFGGEALRHVGGAVPLLFLLVDLEQAPPRQRGAGALGEPREYGLRAVEDARLG